MAKILEFENVYVELPESYVLEEEEKAERVIDVAEPTIEAVEEKRVDEEMKLELVEEEDEEVTPETDEQEVTEEEPKKESKIIIDLPPSSKIVEDALKDIEAAEEEEKKKETEDPAVTKQATTKLSFEELQKRLEETQALHL